MEFDEQEELIIKALIKDPRMSDNNVGKLTGVPIRTVSRKRQKLEKEGKISYYVTVSQKVKKTARHLYIIKFKLGMTKGRILDDIKKEPHVKSIFTEMIYHSRLGEIDGHTALLMIIEAKSDTEISENFNGKILPKMLENHGKDSIFDIKTMRISDTIRNFHNYLPQINMEGGKLKKNIQLDSIHLCY